MKTQTQITETHMNSTGHIQTSEREAPGSSVRPVSDETKKAIRKIARHIAGGPTAYARRVETQLAVALQTFGGSITFSPPQ
jgi:hypothetical protein